MPFCPKCGAEVKENQDVCLSCGTAISKNATSIVSEEGSTTGWGVLGFFFPLIGLILYLVWKTDKPKAAKSAGKGALIGVIAGFVLGILEAIIVIAAGI
ncbi:MAG TPA: zinc-ribbon domain-containing protein [Bacillota bacterium]|nr:zinc-ribbon domain-containing protein [Bacillota bacterium]HPF42265.1 zinc-ribbon domain-containing protein [Bacillota bacterium]HPJ86433.1 zinc-ribbon domain-containing protein [Bacillota bacterium]HPQ61968.1 zinc-ribbon domain-containing protein [Bacillota bacterium]